jgi:two-component system, chemotaxis family, sensor kinase CheA
MSGKGGGMEIDREAIMRTFLAEAQERIGKMEEALVLLETRPDDEEVVQAIFRDAHTLKGNSAMLGFQSLTEFTHVLESLLHHVRSRTLPVTGPVVSLLLEAIDVLRRLLGDAGGGLDEMKPSERALLKKLETASEKGKVSGRAETFIETGEERRAVADRRSVTRGERSGVEVTGLNLVTRTLRVDLDRLDQMLDLVGEIAVARGRLRQILEVEGSENREGALEVLGEADRLELNLQELVMKIRMIPVGPTFHQLARTVRDVSRSRKKDVRFLIEGEDVEVDMTVIERMRDPLAHMVRNAVDHGIESPAARKASGKDPQGTVRLRAVHDGGSIVIELSDDGAGVDRPALLARGRARGLVPGNEDVSDSRIDQLIFEPGLSTVEEVTEVSGRGVGMDVVRRNVEELRGSVAVESLPGMGTSFVIRLPLTVAIIDGFIVSECGEQYVIPMDAVVECVDLPAEKRGPDLSGLISLRGAPLPYFRLRRLFGFTGEAAVREKVVVVIHETSQAGFVVDELLGSSQVVIKPLGKLFRGLPGLAGSAILGNGKVALVLDVPKLVKMALVAEKASLAEAVAVTRA